MRKNKAQKLQNCSKFRHRPNVSLSPEAWLVMAANTLSMTLAVLPTQTGYEFQSVLPPYICHLDNIQECPLCFWITYTSSAWYAVFLDYYLYMSFWAYLPNLSIHFFFFLNIHFFHEFSIICSIFSLALAPYQLCGIYCIPNWAEYVVLLHCNIYRASPNLKPSSRRRFKLLQTEFQAAMQMTNFPFLCL